MNLRTVADNDKQRITVHLSRHNLFIETQIPSGLLKQWFPAGTFIFIILWEHSPLFE